MALGSRPKARKASPRPAHYDKNGMERYRVAFLAENKLWLQALHGRLAMFCSVLQMFGAVARALWVV